MMQGNLGRTRWRRLFQTSVLLVTIGCGDTGIERHDLNGGVTFQGTPIAYGKIYFSPDASKNNRGPGSFAQIVDGKYATPPGHGIVGGAYKVRIVGYDAPPAGEGATGGGQPLFPDFEAKFDLPADGGEFNFEVPVATE